MRDKLMPKNNGSIISQSMRMDLEQPAPVAKGIVALGATNSQYNNKSKNQYSSSTGSIIKNIEPLLIKEILTKFESIMTSGIRRDVFYWFLDKKAGIPNMLFCELDTSQKNIYKEIDWLKKHGFIESYGKIRVFKKPGPKPTLYGLPDLSKEYIPKAIIKAQESYNNIYKVVRELTQRIFDDINDEQIQYMKIVNLSKKNSQGFHFIDIAEMTARELQLKGIKVWR